MRYYSEKTNRFYDSVSECVDAEKAFDKAAREAEEKKNKLKAERCARAKAVEEARIAAQEAKKHYRQLMEEFARDYGSYHSTVTSNSIEDVFDWLF